MGINIGTKLDNLTIYVQTNQPYYAPNAIVDGSVYIDVVKPTVVQRLDLCIKGKERIKWIDTGPEGNRAGTGVNKNKNEVFNSTVSLHSFNGTLNQGQYQFPFSFQLPDNIPGSFDIKHENHEGRVKYTLIGILYVGTSDPIKYRSELIVRQQPLASDYSVPKVQDQHVSICCKNHGRCVLKCKFQSDNYQPGQEAMLMCGIDNSSCSALIKHFEVSLTQRLSFTGPGYNRTFDRIVVREQFPCVQGRANKLDDPILMSLKLEEKENLLKKIPLQPNVHGQLVDCKYNLTVTPAFDAKCGCCADTPSVSLDLYIYAAPLSTWVPSAPSTFRPQLYNQTKIILPVGKLKDNIAPPSAILNVIPLVNPSLKIDVDIKEKLPTVSVDMDNEDGKMKVEVKSEVTSGAILSSTIDFDPNAESIVVNPYASMDGSRAGLAGPNPDGSLMQIEADSVVFTHKMTIGTNINP